MFNLQGSELIIILLLALVVLGPEKLPEAMRKAGNLYAELKKMSTGFQKEFREAIEEPAREMRETANLLRDSADFTNLTQGDRPEKPKSAEMGSPEMVEPADPSATPTEDVPFTPPPAPPPPFQPSGPAEPSTVSADDASPIDGPADPPADSGEEQNG